MKLRSRVVTTWCAGSGGLIRTFKHFLLVKFLSVSISNSVANGNTRL